MQAGTLHHGLYPRLTSYHGDCTRYTPYLMQKEGTILLLKSIKKNLRKHERSRVGHNLPWLDRRKGKTSEIQHANVYWSGLFRRRGGDETRAKGFYAQQTEPLTQQPERIAGRAFRGVPAAAVSHISAGGHRHGSATTECSPQGFMVSRGGVGVVRVQVS